MVGFSILCQQQKIKINKKHMHKGQKVKQPQGKRVVVSKEAMCKTRHWINLNFKT